MQSNHSLLENIIPFTYYCDIMNEQSSVVNFNSIFFSAWFRYGIQNKWISRLTEFENRNINVYLHSLWCHILYFIFNIGQSIWIQSLCTFEAFYYVANHSIATIIGFWVFMWFYFIPKSQNICPKSTS